MKAVIVIDMPDGVSLDEWYAVEVTVDRLKVTEDELLNGIPFDESKTFKFVPLRPLPHKKMPKQGEAFPQDMRLIDRWRGWDACIDEIMGETE